MEFPLLELQVIATTEEGTRAALAEARQLSADRNPARVVLLVPQVVSCCGSPDEPTETARVAAQYRDLAALAGVDVTVRLCVCRRLDEVFRWMLSKHSVVVLGGRRRWWWHTTAQDLARHLRKTGHHVVFADVGRRSS